MANLYYLRINGGNLKNVSLLKNVNSVTIDASNMNMPELANLPNLQGLCLSGVHKADDIDAATIAKLKNLNTLYVGTDVSPDVVQELQQKFPNLSILSDASLNGTQSGTVEPVNPVEPPVNPVEPPVNPVEPVDPDFDFDWDNFDWDDLDLSDIDFDDLGDTGTGESGDTGDDSDPSDFNFDDFDWDSLDLSDIDFGDLSDLIDTSSVANSGTTNAGTTNAGTTNAGTANNGTANTGTTNAGTTNTGAANTGNVNSNANAGTANNGTAKASDANNGAAKAGDASSNAGTSNAGAVAPVSGNNVATTVA